MRDEPVLQESNLQTFRDILIPRVFNGSARLVLAHPAVHGAAKESHRLPADISVLSKRAPLLSGRRQRSSYLRIAAWPEAGFHASRFPLLICVLDGEIDLRLGITKPMTQEYSHLDADLGYQVWRLPENSICLVPPGVPYDDGSEPSS